MNVLINLMVGIHSQCLWISNHYIVHFKYFTILFVNYISVKLEGKKEKEMGLSWEHCSVDRCSLTHLGQTWVFSLPLLILRSEPPWDDLDLCDLILLRA